MSAATVHDLVQGSPEWQAFRLQYDGASEAAAMLGLSPYMTRPELLRMKKLGIAREFSDFVQKRVLDKGHEVEALARPHVEAIIGESLYPATCSRGRQSASCDGLTLDDRIAFEHKQFADELFAAVQAGEVPEHHMPQCQQVLMVTGAEKLAFVCSDGTPERMALAWVYPDEAWFQRLRDGWAQFERDLATYELPPASDPAPVGQAPETLPALRIEITGAVTASNLAEFKATALGAIRSVNRELTTDQHFADAEKAVTWCAEVEKRLAAAKQHALSQTATIDDLFKTIDDISAEARRVRLDLDKLVTKRKAEVKEAEVMKARDALALHLEAVNVEIAPARLQHAVDFGACIKGLKTIDSVRAKLDAAVAAAKIEVDGRAREIRANLTEFNRTARESFGFLFADLTALLLKPADDFRAQVEARVAQHRAAEEEKKRKADEAAKAAADAAAAAATAALAQAAAPAPAPMTRQQVAEVQATVPSGAPQAYAHQPQQNLLPVHNPAKASAPADEPATLTLGAICERLQFTVRSEFVADALHIKPAATPIKGRGLYTETQFRAICRQLQSHVGAMAELYAGETA